MIMSALPRPDPRRLDLACYVLPCIQDTLRPPDDPYGTGCSLDNSYLDYPGAY